MKRLKYFQYSYDILIAKEAKDPFKVLFSFKRFIKKSIRSDKYQVRAGQLQLCGRNEML